MLRMLAIFGFGAMFLMISPPTREMLADWLANGVHRLDQHSPFSYAALAVVGFGGFIVSLRRGSAPR